MSLSVGILAVNSSRQLPEELAYLNLSNFVAYRQRHISKLSGMVGISSRYSTSTRVRITNGLHLYNSYSTLNKMMNTQKTSYYYYTGRSPVGRRPTGVAHSKITRVRVLSWPLPVRTSLHFLTCHRHENLSHEISNKRIRIVRVNLIVEKKHKSTYKSNEKQDAKVI